jgi:hypothetical protein
MKNNNKIVETVEVRINENGQPHVVVCSTRVTNEPRNNQRVSHPKRNTDSLLKEIFE